MTTTRTDERDFQTDQDASGQVIAQSGRDADDGPARDPEEVVIPVAREELEVGKRRVETDVGVRVRKTVHEREVVVDEPLEKDEVQIERVKVGRPVDGPLDVRYEGETLIIPVVEEVLVVERRLMLQEEIRVTRRHREVRLPQHVTLRSEQVNVERIGSGDAVEAATASHVRPDAQCPPVLGAEVESAAADASLLEQRRRQTELQRGRIESSGEQG